MPRLSEIACIVSFEISVVPFSPLKMAKYEMAVSASPAQIEPMYLKFFLYLNENKSLDNHIMPDPNTNAITTEIRIPEIIVSALAELIYSIKTPVSVLQISTNATATAAPNNSKINDTVVDVGKPKVLKTSRRITSVTITARNNIIICGKVNMPG